MKCFFQRSGSGAQESRPQREVRVEATHPSSALITVATLFLAALEMSPRDRKETLPPEEGTARLLPYE